MKKSLLICGTLLLAAMAQQSNAQLALENFNSGTLPPNWILINDGQTVSSSFTTSTAIQTALTASAWIPYQVISAGNYSMMTTSLFTPSGTADRWLITPSFTVNSPNTILKWDDYDLGSAEKLQILLSPTAGTTAAAFTTTLSNQSAGTGGGLVTHAVSLSSYNTQTIRIAFRDNTTNNWGLVVDNVAAVALVSAVDAELTTLTPGTDDPAAYGLTGSSITLKGSVKNQGINTLTGFTIKYQQGTGPVQSYTVSGVNIPLQGSYNFSHNVPFMITATGAYPIKAWVETTGDGNHVNDTARTTITGVSRMPAKKLVVEEATGTWCGWCVRGIVYMDSLMALHPNEVSLIAVHNNDPMKITAYDAWMGTQIEGYPSVVIDRREVADPSDILDVFDAEKDYFGFADITLGAPTKTATTYEQPVSIKPATNMTGDYRLVMVMTEDNVTGTASGYAQRNYYSYTSANQPLTGGGVDYQALPGTIPAAQMHYNFVARDISPSVTGGSGVLPASMTAETIYTATLTGTLNSAWDNPHMRAVVLLINNATGAVLNSNYRGVAVGVSNAQVGVAGLRVFPNPAQDAAHVSFSLAQPSAVQVQVVDALGRIVYTQAHSMTAGAQSVNINLASFSAGLYNVIVRTEGGSITQRLSVVK